MSDTRKMIWTEAGICYVAATFIGFFVGKGLFLIFRKFIADTVGIEGKTGSYSKLTFPVICLFALGIYGLSFLLMKELEADFRIITSTQESVRKADRKVYGWKTGNRNLYLIFRSGMALILSYIRNKQERNYYRHLLQRQIKQNVTKGERNNGFRDRRLEFQPKMQRVITEMQR